MRISIFTIGKAKGTIYADLYDFYAAQIKHPLLSPLTLHEIDLKQSDPAKEGDALQKIWPDGAFVMALTETGKEMRSLDFAQFLDKLPHQGIDHLAFILGGADGLDARILAKVNGQLSLGKMTWPHLMARCLLVEQIYRAGQILIGHPYHREGLPS